MRSAKLVRNPKLRALVYERDKGICARCKRYDAKWQHDHIQELWEGGKDTLDNSQTLCRLHHAEKTAPATTKRAKSDRLAERHALTLARRTIA